MEAVAALEVRVNGELCAYAGETIPAQPRPTAPLGEFAVPEAALKDGYHFVDIRSESGIVIQWAEIAVGGEYDDSEGYFVRPTVLLSDDPTDEAFRVEYFGPILAVHVYPDEDYDRILDVIDTGARYALTGAVIADDRTAIRKAEDRLRYAAGNFYINDKPTGAVVGQQPFGGSRASGTNDKAGSPLNLLRWTSARTIKETFAPATDHRYPHMEP